MTTNLPPLPTPAGENGQYLERQVRDYGALCFGAGKAARAEELLVMAAPDAMLVGDTRISRKALSRWAWAALRYVASVAQAHHAAASTEGMRCPGEWAAFASAVNCQTYSAETKAELIDHMKLLVELDIDETTQYLGSAFSDGDEWEEVFPGVHAIDPTD